MSALYQAMKRVVNEYDANKAGTNVHFGTVRGEKPLEIELDSKLRLEERFFVVAEHLTDYEIEFELNENLTGNELTGIRQIEGWYAQHEGQQTVVVNSGGIQGYTGKGTVKLLNHLKAGDRVIVLRMEGGQQFVVADRIGKVN